MRLSGKKPLERQLFGGREEVNATEGHAAKTSWDWENLFSLENKNESWLMASYYLLRLDGCS